MLDLKFTRTRCRVIVHTEIVDRLRSFRQQNSNDREACGVLLGYQDAHTFEIVDMTEPQMSDQRYRNRFVRGTKGHVDVALERWNSSGGLVGYLGEWHSHAEARPSPSRKDYFECTQIAKRNSSFTLMLIIGTEYGCCTVVSPTVIEPSPLFLLAV